MSVRVTERLIGDVVIAVGLPNSPLMIVQSIDEESKMVATTWFSDSHEYQEGLFPASALNRAETPEMTESKVKGEKAVVADKKSAAEKKNPVEKKAVPGRRGRKPKAK